MALGNDSEKNSKNSGEDSTENKNGGDNGNKNGFLKNNFDWKQHYLHPITVVTILMLLSIFVLLGLNLNNIFDKLQERNFARGLITYLFAVGTIGASVILILSALLSDAPLKERLDTAKDTLTLLIGIFGTILGFYFGTELSQETREINNSGINGSGIISLNLENALAPDSAYSGSIITVSSKISGGRKPYRYEISLSPDFSFENSPSYTEELINDPIAVPAIKKDSIATIFLRIKDSNGDSIRVSRRILLRHSNEIP